MIESIEIGLDIKSQLIKKDGKIHLALIEYWSRDFEIVNNFIASNQLRVCDFPLGIKVLSESPEFRKSIRPTHLNFSSNEYLGFRNGKQMYEVWHSVGSLSTSEGLLNLIMNMPRGSVKTEKKEFGYIKIPIEEWNLVGNERFLGIDVPRIHLSDVKLGNVPEPGSPYTVYADINKDKPSMGIHLDYDSFMLDDRILMITGSPENRELLSRILFNVFDDSEGYSEIGNFHRIHKLYFHDIPRGISVLLEGNNSGVINTNDFYCSVNRYTFINSHKK